MSTQNLTREIFHVKGYNNRSNNVIYSPPTNNVSDSIVVYFGGDIQNFNENMMKNETLEKYIKWSLNNIALLLRQTFCNSHIIVVQPCRIVQTFSCFDNFVKSTSNTGNPFHLPTHGGLEHLQGLIKNVLLNKSIEGDDKDSLNAFEDLSIKLIGFSKGCVVLNQFLYEFYYWMEKGGNNDIINFIKQITDMYWLDGGHNGGQNVWITTDELLQTLILLGIKVHAHVTPYQVRDKRRPHIGTEEAIFSKFLADNGGQIHRVLHFGDEEPSVDNHFKVITETFNSVNNST
ncbi:UPF0565 protein C2orf69 homolog [Chrysoperla carnea]|uniref:UPF0565 protein C2orf69 homolog n=1 Tax=Chrysoperla carnea TaxID=189513 RepID=UPI001D0963B5|nr:UPF0565 protein C2orf69 homolog [Chrysoperla carnea]XP_044736577.1 UPF0565 protein C2orf69 homolog [Chrysoperla carnea]